MLSIAECDIVKLSHRPALRQRFLDGDSTCFFRRWQFHEGADSSFLGNRGARRWYIRTALRAPRQTKYEKESWEGSAASWPGVHKFYSTSNATALQDDIWYEDAMTDRQGRVLLLTGAPGGGKTTIITKIEPNKKDRTEVGADRSERFEP